MAFGLYAIPAIAETNSVEFLNSQPINNKLPFSEAVKVNNTLYLSGQIGIEPDSKKLASGGVEEF